MQNATMLYRIPGPHVWEGVRHDYRIVDRSDNQDFEEAIAAGWSLTIQDAVRRAAPPQAMDGKPAKKKKLDDVD